ncbi:MAG: leucine--tRNA ligase [Chloroflexi bacterium]|nr:leucine--tRNA ligase [Chloroflexota bacterium]
MTQQMRQTELRWEPQALDKKWQERWERDGLYRWHPDSPGEKWYELTMYPYPSGDLHIGHWYAMAPYDAHVRFLRMRGRNVLSPIGFDAFGLPAENAAIRHGIHPYAWTMGNIENMRRQLRSMGAAFNWGQEIVCCLPEYYRWNQWLFLQFLKHDLAYRTKAPAVWCPSCQTVLANEQVVNGRCERCSTPITRRELDQWFLRTTRYAEELLDFSGLVDWPEKIITMQRNWIGRSEGVEVGLDISHLRLQEKELRVFTTRVDTIYGVTFMVLAPEHPLVLQLTVPERRHQVEAYIDEARRKSDIERLTTEREKTGVFLGTYCVNRVNGERVPIYTADYAVAWYATGAVMGVPAHDQRDFEFAQQEGLPVRVVIAPPDWGGSPLAQAYVGPGLQVNSSPFDGLPNEQGKEAIARHLDGRGWGKKTVIYRMRDWLISRQRYWGTPIPVVYCQKCGTLPVPENQLPVLLPENAEFKPTGESPLKRHPDFVNTSCPQCGADAARETDTMDTFFDSSWYFLRYLSPSEDKKPWDEGLARRWMPVDQYTGGAEHAVMHLLYARFFCKALRDMGLVHFSEPFLRLFNQGVIIAEGAKMSKSRGNVITPDPYVRELGADIVRCYLMFVGPWDRGGEWSDAGINGVARWLNRAFDLALLDPSHLRDGAPLQGDQSSGNRQVRQKLHQAIKKVSNDLEQFKFNTAIATLMDLSNHLRDAWEARTVTEEVWHEAVEKFLLMLAPLAPHLAEELWERTDHTSSIHRQRFPAWDEGMAAAEVITLVVQVDGRVRDRIPAPADIGEEEARRLALESPNVRRHIGDREVASVIYVPGRLVNVVSK